MRSFLFRKKSDKKMKHEEPARAPSFTVSAMGLEEVPQRQETQKSLPTEEASGAPSPEKQESESTALIVKPEEEHLALSDLQEHEAAEVEREGDSHRTEEPPQKRLTALERFPASSFPKPGGGEQSVASPSSVEEQPPEQEPTEPASDSVYQEEMARIASRGGVEASEPRLMRQDTEKEGMSVTIFAASSEQLPTSPEPLPNSPEKLIYTQEDSGEEEEYHSSNDDRKEEPASAFSRVEVEEEEVVVPSSPPQQQQSPSAQEQSSSPCPDHEQLPSPLQDQEPAALMGETLALIALPEESDDHVGEEEGAKGRDVDGAQALDEATLSSSKAAGDQQSVEQQDVTMAEEDLNLWYFLDSANLVMTFVDVQLEKDYSCSPEEYANLKEQYLALASAVERGWCALCRSILAKKEGMDGLVRVKDYISDFIEEPPCADLKRLIHFLVRSIPRSFFADIADALRPLLTYRGSYGAVVLLFRATYMSVDFEKMSRHVASMLRYVCSSPNLQNTSALKFVMARQLLQLPLSKDAFSQATRVVADDLMNVYGHPKTWFSKRAWIAKEHAKLADKVFSVNDALQIILNACELGHLVANVPVDRTGDDYLLDPFVLARIRARIIQQESSKGKGSQEKKLSAGAEKVSAPSG